MGLSGSSSNFYVTYLTQDNIVVGDDCRNELSMALMYVSHKHKYIHVCYYFKLLQVILYNIVFILTTLSLYSNLLAYTYNHLILKIQRYIIILFAIITHNFLTGLSPIQRLTWVFANLQ